MRARLGEMGELDMTWPLRVAHRGWTNNDGGILVRKGPRGKIAVRAQLQRGRGSRHDVYPEVLRAVREG
jgi:hypothetical protein